MNGQPADPDIRSQQEAMKNSEKPLSVNAPLSVEVKDTTLRPGGQGILSVITPCSGILLFQGAPH